MIRPFLASESIDPAQHCAYMYGRWGGRPLPTSSSHHPLPTSNSQLRPGWLSVSEYDVSVHPVSIGNPPDANGGA